ncbi:MAG: 16S rRNA (cytosine(1402)-N(4))-methyltransferase RsmH [Candidatus Campbellbacteria bacterium]|nr:16S rRNA (cytosine(1402)-N(4))-methyltransferase RsmH [Candidatus Campbellbacteria bacterium]
MTHKTVLLHETIDGLDFHPGDTFLDGTFNDGGHSVEVCKTHQGSVRIIGIDLDSDALSRAREVFLEKPCRITLHEENFKNLDTVLDEEDIEEVDAILFDLGFSSVQLEESGRGFSFLRDEPLKMTLSKEESGLTAKEIVNEWDQEHIESIIRHYGEERRAKKIAEKIVEARSEKPITSTKELAEIISEATGKRKSKIHPATKTFQALRITVNDEIESLKTGLEKGFERLSPDGRFAVISFHSLEDRIVKRFFRNKHREGLALNLTKKPITPTPEEIQNNRRSRSAKLRIIKKLKI